MSEVHVTGGQNVQKSEGSVKKTVLIVDDARVMRQAGTMALTSEGFRVIEAENGRDALNKIQGERIDLVITDVNMPEMDGIELIRNLRQLPDFRFVPIIVLSTVSQQEKVAEGKAAGATGWLYKPYNHSELIRTVRKIMS